MADTIRDFLVSLDFKVDSGQQRKMDEALRAVDKTVQRSAEAYEKAEQTKMKAQATATAFAITKFQVLVEAAESAARAISQAFTGIVASYDRLYYVSGRTSATVQNLVGLGHAFSQVGGSSQQALAAVESFTAALRNNPGLAGFVKGLGVSDKLDGVDKMLATVEQLNKTQPRYVAKQQAGMLGISEESYDLLTRQMEGIKRYRAEYKAAAQSVGLNSEEAAKASHWFSQALGSLGAVFEVAFTKLLTDQLPRISGWLDQLSNWIKSHQPEIGQFVQMLTDRFEAFGQKMEEAFKSLMTSLNDGSFQKGFDDFLQRVDRIAAGIGRIIDIGDKLVNSTFWKVLTFPNPVVSLLLGNGFPESMRGTGEGHRDWDTIPDTLAGSGRVKSAMTNGTVKAGAAPAPRVKSAMTNGTVAKTSTAGGDQTLTLTYSNGQTLAVVVTPQTPIVAYEPTDRSALRSGSKVFVLAERNGGKLTAVRAMVGKDGLTPPM